LHRLQISITQPLVAISMKTIYMKSWCYLSAGNWWSLQLVQR